MRIVTDSLLPQGTALRLTIGVLLVAIGGVFNPLQQARAQANCITSASLGSSTGEWEISGNWDDDRNDNGIPDGNESSTGNSAIDNDSGAPCDNASSGYPSASDEDATISEATIEVTDGSKLTVGNVDIDNDGALQPKDPGKGSNFDRTLEFASLDIRQSTDPFDGFESTFNAKNGGGKLSLLVTGDASLSGQSSSVSKFLTEASVDTIGIAGKLTVNANAEVSAVGDTIAVGNFTNDGTINLGGGKLNATKVGFGNENGPNSSASLTLGTGGVLDVNGTFTNDTNGSLDFSDATLELSGSFTNNGTFTTNSSSLTVFNDGDLSNPTLSGTLSGSNAFFVDLRIEDDEDGNPSLVDPQTKVKVTGKLTVKSGNQYGSGDSEDSDLRYEGEDFSANGDLYANRVEFAANNITNGSADSYTTVSGAVFAEVEIDNNTAVEVGTASFTVFGLVSVTTGCILSVEGNATGNSASTLDLAGDLRVDGEVQAESGTFIFNGEGRTTDCSLSGSDLDCTTENSIQEYSGSSVSFNALRIQDEDGDGTVETKVEFSDSGSPVTVTSDLIIDEATLTTARPITVNNGNVTVQNGGDLTFNNDRKLTFTGSSPGDVITPGGLTVSVVEIRKGSGTQTLKNNLTVTDSLKMTSGTLVPEQDLTIQERLVLGGQTVNTSTLDVTGGGGNVTLVSSSSDDAYVRYVDSDNDGVVDGSVNGDLTFERQFDATANWFYLASPQGTNNANDTFTAFLEQGADNDLYTAGVQGSDNPSLTEASVRLYDETEPGDINPDGDAVDQGWKGIDCSDYTDCVGGMGSQMKSGRGYAVYVYNNGNGFPKTINSDVEPSTSDTSFAYADSDGNATSEGPGIYVTDNDGDGVDKNEGWNLLGNPYFATIDFCTVRNSGGTEDIKPTVEVWDPANTDGQSTSGYASYNCSMESGAGTNTTLTNGYISPHQSFFVKAEPNGGDGLDELGLSINIIEDQVKQTGYFQKRGTEQERSKEKPPAVALQLNFDKLRYTTSIGFVEGAKKERGFHDGYYTDGAAAKSGPSFSSVASDGTLIATNALPREFSEETTVPLAIDGCDYGTALSGEATIKATMLRNLPPSWGVTLEDTKTGETVDLSDVSRYTFDYTGDCPTSKSRTTSDSDLPGVPSPSVTTHSSAKDGSAPDTRFKLHLDPDAVPPVELSSLTAEAREQAAVLSWTTARARNLEAFHVQRKTDDGSFTTLENAVVTAPSSDGSSESSSTYEYQVDRLDAGTHTFRLKQVTSEGTTFSDPVDVKIGLDGEYQLSTYPNPVRTQATVEFAVKESADVTLALYNTLGQKVRTVYRGTPPAEETKRVQVDTRDLSSGAYFLRLEGEGVTGTKRMTIVK